MSTLPLRLLAVALIAITCMAFVPVLVKSTSANEATIGLVRLAIAVSIFSPLIYWWRSYRGLSRRDWGMLIVIGLVFGGHWLTYFYSIKLATASLAVTGISTYGIHLLVLNWLFNGTRFSIGNWLAIAVCFIGCLLLAPELSLGNEVTLGLLIGVASGLLYAALPLLHQRLQHIPTPTRAWGQFTFALLVFLPLSGNTDWQLTTTDWWQLLALGVVCTVVAHSLWVKVSTELPAMLISTVYYLCIPLSMVLSLLFLGEPITLQKSIGALLIISANLSQSLLPWWRAVRRQQQ